MSFGGDLQRFADRAMGRTELVFKKVALEVMGRTIMRTPVDTGRLRSNWLLTLDQPASGTTESDGSGEPTARPDGGGTGPARELLGPAIDAANLNNVIWLTNNLPYAGVIEYDAHSKQAPAGMVRVSVREFADVVREVAGT